MQTLEHRVGILEKRVDNHGEEIDDLDDRVVEGGCMIEKLKKDIEELKIKISKSEENQTKLYGLLNNATLQVEEIQQKLEKLQLKNQASNNEIKRLEIVKGYLEEVEEEEGTENEQ